MKTETKVDIIAAECESIISCVENVIDLCDSNDFVTNLLQTEEFENIRFSAEELQSFVFGSDSDENEILTSAEIEELSIILYRDCKYILEALDESIQDTDVLNEFGFIRASVSIIVDTASYS